MLFCFNFHLDTYILTLLTFQATPVLPTQPNPPLPQTPNPPTVATAAAPASNQRRSLTLTREQMLEAQEMFRTANRVTRPEKALILGFMAGSRDSPAPHLGKKYFIAVIYLEV